MDEGQTKEVVRRCQHAHGKVFRYQLKNVPVCTALDSHQVGHNCERLLVPQSQWWNQGLISGIRTELLFCQSESKLAFLVESVILHLKLHQSELAFRISWSVHTAYSRVFSCDASTCLLLINVQMFVETLEAILSRSKNIWTKKDVWRIVQSTQEKRNGLNLPNLRFFVSFPHLYLRLGLMAIQFQFPLKISHWISFLTSLGAEEAPFCSESRSDENCATDCAPNSVFSGCN